MEVKITPDMSLRILKIVRKNLSKNRFANKEKLKLLDGLIKKKQSEHFVKAENKAINNMIKFLQKAIP
jgi:hypothetical protein